MLRVAVAKRAVMPRRRAGENEFIELSFLKNT
jgi:hypothetical protein